MPTVLAAMAADGQTELEMVNATAVSLLMVPPVVVTVSFLLAVLHNAVAVIPPGEVTTMAGVVNSKSVVVAKAGNVNTTLAPVANDVVTVNAAVAMDDTNGLALPAFVKVSRLRVPVTIAFTGATKVVSIATPALFCVSIPALA